LGDRLIFVYAAFSFSGWLSYCVADKNVCVGQMGGRKRILYVLKNPKKLPFSEKGFFALKKIQNFWHSTEIGGYGSGEKVV